MCWWQRDEVLLLMVGRTLSLRNWRYTFCSSCFAPVSRVVATDNRSSARALLDADTRSKRRLDSRPTDRPTDRPPSGLTASNVSSFNLSLAFNMCIYRGGSYCSSYCHRRNSYNVSTIPARCEDCRRSDNDNIRGPK